METPNTYTYRQSELPPITSDIKSEICEIDFKASNLILKIQGNYLALYAFAETLGDLLDSCELNLQCIRVIPDGGGNEAASRAIGLTDLPKLEKQLLISTAITTTVAINVIANMMGCSFDQAASYVSRIGEEQVRPMSLDQMEMVVAEISKQLQENSDKEHFVIRL